MRFFRVVQIAGNLFHGRGKTFEVIVGRGRALMPEHFLNFSQGRRTGRRVFPGTALRRPSPSVYQ